MITTLRVTTQEGLFTRFILDCLGIGQMNLERITQSRQEEKGERPSASLDAMSRALRRVTQSPLSEEMEHTEMPKHFTRSPFTCYSGKTDVEHVSHHT